RLSTSTRRSPACTTSPVSTWTLKISPDAFDFTSTVRTGSMTPDASTFTRISLTVTGSESYSVTTSLGSGWQPASIEPPSAATSTILCFDEIGIMSMSHSRVRIVLFDRAVAQNDDAARVSGDVGLVGHENDRVPRCVKV